MELAGKTVLLTGATGGLGRAIATALGEREAKVILSSRTSGRPRRARARLARRPAPHDRLRPRRGGRGAAPARGGGGDRRARRQRRRCPPRASSTASVRSRSSAPCGSTSRRRSGCRASCVPRLVERGSGHLVFISSLSGKARDRARVALLRHQVRPPRLRARTARGPARQRRGRLRGDAGRDSRRRDVRRLRRLRPTADGHRHARAGRCGGHPSESSATAARSALRPLRQRALSAMAANAPELSGRLAGGTATKVADEIARGQTEKR